MALGEERERGEAKGVRLPPRLTKAQRQRAEERRGQKGEQRIPRRKEFDEGSLARLEDLLVEVVGGQIDRGASSRSRKRAHERDASHSRTDLRRRARVDDKNNGERQCGCTA